MPLSRAQSTSEFPASTTERFYIGYGLVPQTILPTQNTILYHGIYIKKDVTNPTLAVSQVGSSANTILAGIYDGANGLVDAPLLVSSTITTDVAAAIYTTSLSISLRRGFYILAGVVTSAVPTQFQGMSITGRSFEVFGRETSITSLDTNYYITQTGQTSLPSTIGTITRTNSLNNGAYVFIRY